MSLVFDTAATPTAADPQRADVACFVGYVARRAGAPLPAALRAQLRAGGWVDGIWRRPAGDVENLLNLPLALDSWAQFDALYAWDTRPLRAGGDDMNDQRDAIGTGACYLGAAVRSFFARGGRRAVIVRVGDPWPMIENAAARTAARDTRLARLLPTDVFAPHDPSTWHGIQHLYGLREVSLLLLPDLPDACSTFGAEPAAALPPPAVPTAFVECSDNDVPPDDGTLARLPSPRLDDAGYIAWRDALSAAQRFPLARREQREVLLLAALPLPQLDTQHSSSTLEAVHAQSDIGAYLQRIDVLRETPLSSDVDPGASSAFIQLAWPWLQTTAAVDLPQTLEPPDGVLAGLIAAGAGAQGTFRSVAGDFSVPLLRDIGSAEPIPAWGASDDSADALLAQHVCVFAPQPGGWALQSDVTLSSQEAWRFGGASRLMGSLLRSARAAGDGLAFDLNGPATWAQVRRAMETLLDGWWREGAFGGADANTAYAVRCDRTTMTQNDLDNGRLIVEISVLPAASIERITVVLNLNTAAATGELRAAA